jgi:hypothetical protein
VTERLYTEMLCLVLAVHFLQTGASVQRWASSEEGVRLQTSERQSFMPTACRSAVLAGPVECMGRAGQVLPPAPLEVQGEPLEKQLPASDGAGSLSEKLERSKGEITPPASGTDPGIVKSAPDTGETKMPAIPPPGTPGGDPNVRPQ